MEPTMVSPSDLALMRRAQAALRQAQATIEFVTQHIAETYRLTKDDTVDMSSGEIRRATTE